MTSAATPETNETNETSGIAAAVVVGAGTMGHGIAHVLALAGIETTLVDVEPAAVAAGLARIRENLDAGVRKGKVDASARDAALARLRTATDLSAIEKADLFIEAVPERLDLKRRVFTEADARAPRGALLASNTSSLSITAIAAATKRPEDVVGLHFFNPVHVMKLLEIVRGGVTSDDALRRARALGQRLGKTCVVAQDAPGFATSRLGVALGLEAIRTLEEGVATASDIDTALKLGYGHPMGPLALTDLVGLDVRLAIAEALHHEMGTDTFRPPRLLKQLVRLGHVGKKAGRGFYLWDERGEIAGENPAAVRSTRG
jgi:3-hydroxybutyryl-CoA dehydrogenase